MAILETKNLKKIYGSGAGEVRALDGIDMSVESGEFVAVVGSSGSGKSTLLHMLGGLDRPTSGKVFVDGRDIFSLKDEALTIFRRRKIGFVFQAYNLVPVLNVYENIVLPVELDGRISNGGLVNDRAEVFGGTAADAGAEPGVGRVVALTDKNGVDSAAAHSSGAGRQGE